MRIPPKQIDQRYANVYLASVLGTSMAAVPSGSLLICDNSAAQILPVSPAIGFWVDIRIRSGSFPSFSSASGNEIYANGAATQTLVVNDAPSSFRLVYTQADKWDALFESLAQVLGTPT